MSSPTADGHPRKDSQSEPGQGRGGRAGQGRAGPRTHDTWTLAQSGRPWRGRGCGRGFWCSSARAAAFRRTPGGREERRKDARGLINYVEGSRGRREQPTSGKQGRRQIKVWLEGWSRRSRMEDSGLAACAWCLGRWAWFWRWPSRSTVRLHAPPSPVCSPRALSVPPEPCFPLRALSAPPSPSLVSCLRPPPESKLRRPPAPKWKLSITHQFVLGSRILDLLTVPPA